MSLINEALKKAQRQRMEDPVAVPPAPVGTTQAPVARIAKRRPPMPARTLTLLIGGGTAVIIMAGVLAYLFLIPESAPPVPAKPLVATAPATPVVPATPVPTSSAPALPAAPVEVAIKLPPITPPAPLPAPTAPVTMPVKTPAPAPAAVTPTANPKVYEFLETLRIAGIRVSATDPKVIMNDRVFRLNDLVDRTTQLRLLKIETSVLVFVDASGFEYRKNF